MRVLNFQSSIAALTVFAMFSGDRLLGFEPHTAEELIGLGTYALRRHSLGQAEEFFRQALSRMPDNATAEHVLLLNKLGQALEGERRFDQAETEFRQALDETATITDAGPELKIVSLGNLASVEHAQGRLQDARKSLESANELLSGREEATPEITVSIWTAMASLLHGEHRPIDAKALFARALELLDRRGGVDTATQATLFINAGLLHYESGEYPDAVKMLQRAASLQNVPAYERAMVEHNLGGVQFAIGDLPAAEQALKAAVDLDPVPEPGACNITESLTLLGLVQAKRGERQEAAASVTRARSAAETCHAGDVTLSHIYNTAGTVAQVNGDRQKAKQNFERSAQLAENKDVQAYAVSLKSLAELERSVKHHAEAEAFFRQVLATDRSTVPLDYRKLATDLCAVAAEAFYRKHIPEAFELYKEAEDTLARRPGADDADLAHIKLNVAILLWRQKLLEAAQQEFSGAVDLFRSADPDSSQFIVCLRDYARVLRSTQRFVEAEQADLLATNLQVKKALREDKDRGEIKTVDSFS